jgi:hypothetical protein
MWNSRPRLPAGKPVPPEDFPLIALEPHRPSGFSVKMGAKLDELVKSRRNQRRQPNLLVPKLSLGTQVDAKLSFAN